MTNYTWDGRMKLNNGKEIIVKPTNDLFLNYSHRNNTGAEELSDLVNIFLEDLNEEKTYMPLVEKGAKVRDQYKYLLDDNNARKQDFRLEKKRYTYMEFQNQISASKPPVKIRGVEYFGLGIRKGADSKDEPKDANQIWFLAEHYDEVLGELSMNVFSLYSDITGDAYPVKSKILFIDLKRVAEQGKSAAQELAKFLLGRKVEPKSARVRRIIRYYKQNFRKYKKEKEVTNMLTMREERALEERAKGIAIGRTEGRAEGKAEGKVEGIINVYYNEMEMSISQIAHRLGLSEKEVYDIIQGNE